MREGSWEEVLINCHWRKIDAKRSGFFIQLFIEALATLFYNVYTTGGRWMQSESTGGEVLFDCNYRY